VPDGWALALIAIVASLIIAGNVILYFYLAVTDAPLRPDTRRDALLVICCGMQAAVGVLLEDWFEPCDRWHFTILTVSGLIVVLLPDSPFWWFANRFGTKGAWVIAGTAAALVLSLPLGALYFGDRARELHGSSRP